MTADFEERYDITTAAAWILGHAGNTGLHVLPETIGQKKAFECSAEELDQIIDAGLEAGLKLYPFKKGTQVLQRTRRTLGFLHSVSFGTMLDVGSGQVFLRVFQGKSFRTQSALKPELKGESACALECDFRKLLSQFRRDYE